MFVGKLIKFLNKEKFNDLDCKTSFKNSIPGDFLIYTNRLLVENKLMNL
jgi:hypothetical protein